MLIEKDNSLGNNVIKAQLCARGDLEAGKHMIPVKRNHINLLLTMVASRGLEVRMNDVCRAFLQAEDISRTVYIKHPVEAGLPPNKGWL